MIGLLAAIERDYVYCLPHMCYWMEFQCVMQMFGVIRAQNYKILAEIMCPKEFCRLFFPLTRQLKKQIFLLLLMLSEVENVANWHSALLLREEKTYKRHTLC